MGIYCAFSIFPPPTYLWAPFFPDLNSKYPHSKNFFHDYPLNNVMPNKLRIYKLLVLFSLIKVYLSINIEISKISAVLLLGLIRILEIGWIRAISARIRNFICLCMFMFSIHNLHRCFFAYPRVIWVCFWTVCCRGRRLSCCASTVDEPEMNLTLLLIFFYTYLWWGRGGGWMWSPF